MVCHSGGSVGPQNAGPFPVPLTGQRQWIALTSQDSATAAKIGMKCVVIQESWVPHEDAAYDRVGNILLTRLMGAESRIVSDGFDIGIRKSWEDAIQSVKNAGGKPYPIPAGASVHKYGGLGYVGFAEEVRAQETQMGIKFDY